MSRSLTHFVAALTVWSTFYCGLAAFGVRPGAAPPSRNSGDTSARARPRCTSPANAGSLYCETVLATSDDWFALGRAIRDDFEYQRSRYGDDIALDRICDVLARNPYITSTSVDRPYVHLIMARRPEYVVYLNTAERDRSNRKIVNACD
jgi:hypothetical protein